MKTSTCCFARLEEDVCSECGTLCGFEDIESAIDRGNLELLKAHGSQEAVDAYLADVKGRLFKKLFPTAKEHQKEQFRRLVEDCVEYLRYVQQEFLDGNSEVSAVQKLDEMVSNNTIPKETYLTMKQLLENLDAPYKINIT